MACCEPFRTPFVLQTQTVINYTASLKEQYGSRPHVFAYYLDTVSGEYVMSSWFTTMRLTPGDVITVDHGGVQTGFVILK